MTLRWRDVANGSPPLTFGQGADYSDPYYEGPVEQWFQSLAIAGAGFQPGSTGKSLCIDPVYDVIYREVDGQVQFWAGVHGESGYVDGLGRQAKFRIGGLQGTLFGVAQDSRGRYYVTDTGNGVIRRLTEQLDKTCVVDTFAIITCEVLVSDADDNLWTAEWNVLKKINTNGQVVASIAAPAKIVGLMRAGNRIFFLTLVNAATVVYELLPATNTFRHHAGLTEDEVNTLGGIMSPTCPVDGPPNASSFYTTYFCYASPDGNTIGLSSGDEDRLILIVNGVSKTLCTDGQYRQLNDRRSSQRFIASNLSGLQSNGYPYAYNFPWVQTGGLTVWKELYLDNAVPEPPGGQMNLGYLNGVNAVGNVSGWVVIGNGAATVNATAQFFIDDQLIDSKVTNGPCQECLDYFANSGGGVVPANVTPWFVWAIPKQFRDGQVHRVKVVASGYQLTNPANGAPHSIDFTIQGEINNMNANTSWTTKVVQLQNHTTFTKWRVSIQVPGVAPVVTTSTSVSIPLPTLPAGTYPVLVERISQDELVVAGSATGSMVIAQQPPAPGPVDVPDVVTIILQ